jgi:Transposase, Mutator family
MSSPKSASLLKNSLICVASRLRSGRLKIQAEKRLGEHSDIDVRSLSTRDIEALFADEPGQSLLSRTAVSEITGRLWAEYEAFASRDLSEFELVYLFVDGIAERLHLGQPLEAVLAAWGILARRQEGSPPLGAGQQGRHRKLQQGRHRKLPRVLPRHASARPARSAAGGERRGAWSHPRDRGVLPALGTPALSRVQDAQPAEQGARDSLAGVQGAFSLMRPICPETNLSRRSILRSHVENVSPHEQLARQRISQSRRMWFLHYSALDREGAHICQLKQA